MKIYKKHLSFHSEITFERLPIKIKYDMLLIILIIFDNERKTLRKQLGRNLRDKSFVS